MHVGTAAAVVVGALVAVGRWFAPGWTAVAFLAVLAVVLLVARRATGRVISLRSGSKTISISAGRRARPTGEVRPLTDPPTDLVEHVKRAVERSGILGAYLYETIVDGQPQPTLGLHLRGQGGVSFALTHAPVSGKQLRVEELDEERLAQVRAVTEPVAGE